MDHIESLVAERVPILASVLVVVCGVLLASALGLFHDNTAAANLIPLVGGEIGNSEKRRKAYIANAREIYAKGYELHKSRAFRITDADGEKVVLPRHLLDEVKRLPEEQINIRKAFDKSLEMKYTQMGDPKHGDFLIHLIRADLTRNLNRINPHLSDEAASTVVNELPCCGDWTSVPVYWTVARMVAIVSGRIFLGPDLCRKEEYIHASINYTVDVFRAISELKKWSPWTRPIGQYFVPELKTVFEHRRKAQEFLSPIIRERRNLMAEGGELPDDMLQWMLNKSSEEELPDTALANLQLGLSLAAIHTTTLTMTLALYDLVVRPELIRELREEIQGVLEANGGVWSSRALFELKLLDSFMKESQRFSPGSLSRFIRYVEKPLTLSDGTHLRAGELIESPAAAILLDPGLYENPETFDAHRFLKLRNGTTADPLELSSTEQYQFATTTREFMVFGYGRHACPGRFFAANEVKLLLANILLNYDVKMPDGVTERYPNIEIGVNSMPDTTKEIMFKRVTPTGS